MCGTTAIHRVHDSEYARDTNPTTWPHFTAARSTVLAALGADTWVLSGETSTRVVMTVPFVGACRMERRCGTAGGRRWRRSNVPLTCSLSEHRLGDIPSSRYLLAPHRSKANDGERAAAAGANRRE